MDILVQHKIAEEYPFIGRENDFAALKQRWPFCRVFGIFGVRAVGKSRFVREFTRRQQDISVLYVRLNSIENSKSFYTVLCATLVINPEQSSSKSLSWIKQITEELNKRSMGQTVVLILDNAEDSLESECKEILVSLCTSIVKQCTNVKIIISSTTRLQFSQLNNIYHSHILKPLSHEESKRFLQNIAEGVELGRYGDSIAELSEGLPLLILMIGAELKLGMATPAEMINLLLICRLQTLSKECYPAEDRVDDVYKSFVDRLSSVYQEFLSVLDFIPGSFNAEEASELLDFETVAVAKLRGLKPILVRHMLNYDGSSQRFNIQSILREVIKANYSVKNLPEVRARYFRIFTAVMKTISNKMGTGEYTKAMSTFVQEQPNLQKLLGEVHNTSQETYPFLIEIASSCTDLIEIYLPNESEYFYNGCLQLADRYGMESDKAAVYIAVGSIETHTKGDLYLGERKYRSALKLLEKKEDCMQLAILYQKLGWNIFKQGLCEDAIRYYMKSLEISSIKGRECESLTLQSLGYLGVVYVVLGKFDIGEKYHKHCLRRSQALQGKIHPKVGDALNRIGLLHDQKGDSKTAMDFFKQGLEVKKKCKAAPISIVYSLSNVANAYNVANNFEEAHKIVDEAFEILNSQKLTMLDGLSLMYNTRGKIFAREGKLREAVAAFRKTVDITRQVEQTSYIFMKRLINLAEVLEKRGKLSASLRVAKEALCLKQDVIKTLPHNFIVTECLQCMSRVYQQTSDLDNYKEVLIQLDKECIRVGQIWTELQNEQKLEKVKETLDDLSLQFSNLTNEQENRDSATTFAES